MIAISFTAVKISSPLTSIMWPYHSSSLELIEVDNWSVTVSFLLDRGLKPGYFSGGEEGSMCKKANFWRKLTPDIDFSSDIFLSQSSLGKSLIYFVHNFYNLGYAYRVNFNWEKIIKPQAEQLVLTTDHFLDFWSKKFFPIIRDDGPGFLHFKMRSMGRQHVSQDLLLYCLRCVLEQNFPLFHSASYS